MSPLDLLPRSILRPSIPLTPPSYLPLSYPLPILPFILPTFHLAIDLDSHLPLVLLLIHHLLFLHPLKTLMALQAFMALQVFTSLAPKSHLL